MFVFTHVPLQERRARKRRTRRKRPRSASAAKCRTSQRAAQAKTITLTRRVTATMPLVARKVINAPSRPTHSAPHTHPHPYVRLNLLTCAGAKGARAKDKTKEAQKRKRSKQQDESESSESDVGANDNNSNLLVVRKLLESFCRSKLEVDSPSLASNETAGKSVTTIHRIPKKNEGQRERNGNRMPSGNSTSSKSRKNRKRRHARRHRERTEQSSSSLGDRQAFESYNLEMRLHEDTWTRTFALQEQRQRHDIQRRHEAHLNYFR